MSECAKHDLVLERVSALTSAVEVQNSHWEETLRDRERDYDERRKLWEKIDEYGRALYGQNGTPGILADVKANGKSIAVLEAKQVEISRFKRSILLAACTSIVGAIVAWIRGLL